MARNNKAAPLNDSLDDVIDADEGQGGTASMPEGSVAPAFVTGKPLDITEPMVESPFKRHEPEPEPEEPFSTSAMERETEIDGARAAVVGMAIDRIDAALEPIDFAEMAASEIPSPMEISAIEPSVPQGELASEPITEHQEAVKELGIGGRIEVEADGFRVVTGSRPPVFGHGKTIDAALYDLKHPGQLEPTVKG
jgi:hypothetical protein